MNVSGASQMLDSATDSQSGSWMGPSLGRRLLRLGQ